MKFKCYTAKVVFMDKLLATVPFKVGIVNEEGFWLIGVKCSDLKIPMGYIFLRCQFYQLIKKDMELKLGR